MNNLIGKKVVLYLVYNPLELKEGIILKVDNDNLENMEIKLDNGKTVKSYECTFIKVKEDQGDIANIGVKMSERLRKRFCKDCNIPIGIFIEPYFTDRLKLYDNQFDTLNKFQIFKDSLVGYKNEEDYFEDYNKFKDAVIMDVKESEGYKKFIEDDFNKYAVDNKGIARTDVYKEHNIGRTFMSIDMVKANFTAMKHYDKTIFKEKESYKEYLSLFTDNKHFIKSKYIRQVIFGNNNPKRQTTYQKYLMNIVLEDILNVIDISNVACFAHDEIVLDITDIDKEILVNIKNTIKNSANNIGINLKIEEFVLSKLGSNTGYVKEFLSGGYEFQCVDRIMLPFILRKYNKQPVIESDKMFIHQNMLSKLIDIPEI